MHIFDHNHSKIIKVILNFLEFASACKKSAYSLSIISSIPSIHLVSRVAKTISDHTHPNIFLPTLNFWYQHVKNTKVDYFITFVLEIYLIWNPAIWLPNTLYDWETN